MASLFVVVAFGLEASGGGKDKKFEVPKNAVTGTVKSVDEKKASFKISTAKGTERTFLVDEKNGMLETQRRRSRKSPLGGVGHTLSYGTT
jgi:hypothetical protein